LDLQYSICPPGPTTSIAISKENLARFRMALLPPSPDGLLQVCRQGFEDSYRYLSSRGLVQCADCRATKTRAGLTNMADWRRSSAGCAGCDQLLEENLRQQLRLPEELVQVFSEAAEEVRLRRQSGVGLITRLSSYSLSVYTRSAMFMGRTAWMMMSGVLPSEKTVKAMMSYSPTLVSCPFDSLQQ
jgi:hypothetical protein